MRRSLLPAYSLMMMNRSAAVQPDEWISIHDTALRTGSTTILLPFSASTGDRTIDWGDGVVEIVNTANPSHTYATNGIYTVTVRGGTTTLLVGGDITPDDGWRFSVTEVVSWGKLGWTSFGSAFRNCASVVRLPSYLPTTLTNTNRMFLAADAFNQDISMWDVSRITDMSFMFRRNALGPSLFNKNIGAWSLRTAGVNLTSMFTEANGGTLSLSVENYSRTLIGWANGIASRAGLPQNVTFGAGTRKYNATVYEAGTTYTNAVDARAYLVSRGWTITDGGLA